MSKQPLSTAGPTDRIFCYETFPEMYLDLARKFLTNPGGMLIDSTRTHVVKSSGVTVEISHPRAEMDFRVFGYKPTRWGRFGRRYMDQAFFKWLDKLAPDIESTQSGYGFSYEEDHNHGNCVLGMSFTRFGRNGIPELTIQSRTAYLMPTSVLELSLGGLIAEYYAKNFGDEIRLRWQVAQLQFSTMWGYPWLAGNYDKVKDILEGPDLLHQHRVNYAQHKKVYDEQISGTKFSAYKRLRRMIQRTSEVATGNYTPYFPTTWPLARLESPLELGVLVPSGNNTEDAWDLDEKDEDDE